MARADDAKNDAIVLSPVVVSEENSQPKLLTGKAEEGYRQTNVNLGPLGDRPILDTPYSVYAVPADLIKNEQVSNYTDLIKYMPSLMQQAHVGSLEIGPPVVRGMVADDSSMNTRIDGMNVRADTVLPFPLYESYQVLTGPSGALYGFSYPAGTLNGVLKRPTDEPFVEVGTDYMSDANGGLRADLGGHLDDGHKVGYRANLIHSNGQGAVDGSNISQDLIDLAMDFNITDNTQIQTNAGRYYVNQKGYPGGFTYTGSVGLPSAPDPSKAGYGQSWSGVTSQNDIYDIKLKHDFGSDWKLEVGALKQMVSRWFTNRYVNVLNANGTYTAKYYPSSGSKSFITSNLANLTGTVYTGPLKHELVLGTNGFDHNAYTVASLAGSAAQTLGISSLDNPTVYPSPSYRGMGGKYKASNTREQTFVQNDTVTFNDQWSVLAGVSESWLHVGNFNSTGAETSSSHASGAVSTTAALMFKPVQTVTTYISYGSSIQPGDSTSDVTAKNVNQVLAPYRSTQYEAGVKSSLSDIDLSAAAFYIERPFAAIDSSSYYRQLGNQDDLGVELTAKGRVTKDVAVFGGVTWLDTKLTDMGRAGSAYAADNGNKVVGIPEWQANLLTEYTVPNLRQLIASLNLHYTGRRAANAENTTWASGYFTTDIGARYQDAVMGHEVTWRAGIDNLFDKHYWASINGNMSGQSGAGNTAFLGDPRTVKASMSVKF